MSVYTSRKFAAVIFLVLCTGGSIVVAARYGIGGLSKAKFVEGNSFPSYGRLSLSALVVSDNEVLLHLTCWPDGIVSQLHGMGFDMFFCRSDDWWSKSLNVTERSLPDGLVLVDGVLEGNGTIPFPNDSLSITARLQAVADGEWTIYGQCRGEYQGLYLSGIQGVVVIVSDGSIVEVRNL